MEDLTLDRDAYQLACQWGLWSREYEHCENVLRYCLRIFGMSAEGNGEKLKQQAQERMAGYFQHCR